MFFGMCRYGSGPLYCGSEPLSYSGASLLDDQTKSDACGGHQDSKRPQRCHP